MAAALDLGQTAVEDALTRAGLRPADVDAMFSVSVTGIASPSIDARLMNRMPLRRDVNRVPIFGLGYVAGAAGVARAAEYVRAFPDHAVQLAWDVLADQGNLSSTSVLMVLREVFDRARPAPGTRGLLLAMGPAFCSEIVMLEW